MLILQQQLQQVFNKTTIFIKKAATQIAAFLLIQISSFLRK
jgi:hypothetical protein